MQRVPQKLSFRVQLGDDIVFEILTWVPANSLMRFKCVSKTWNTLIRHDPDFVKSHIARSHARPSATHLLFEMRVCRRVYERSHERVGFSLQLAPHHYDHCSDLRPWEITICSNQCNGLICFQKYPSRVYLYNVTTREIKALPSSLIDCHWYYSLIFLGFDKVTEKYKLLHVLSFNWPRMEILTLGTNSWRQIELLPHISSPSYCSRHCIFLNGLLYWKENEVKNCIEYFDFREEKFGIRSSSEDQYGNIMKSTSLWKKMAWNSTLPQRYEKRDLIPDEVNKVLMKYNSDDPNLEKVATLELKVERIYSTEYVLAAISYISAPATLVLPSYIRLRHASSFVENIIPLSFFDV